MREINVDAGSDKTFYIGKDKTKFILLGKCNPIKGSKPAINKLKGEMRESSSSIWGTLGMADDSSPLWEGTVRYSGVGCKDSVPEESYDATLDEIKLIYDGRSSNINSNKRSKIVTERFISFENITFHEFPELFTIQDIPSLRLTLFLESDEGAMVFYQHTPQGDRVVKHKAGTKSDESEIEYILPKSTERNDCSSRDRLTYHIPILPPKKIIEKSPNTFVQTGNKRKEKFIIKILTFRRENSESETIIKKLYYHIFKHTHKLLLWNPTINKFEVPDGSEIDGSKKTLFLIHGTMSHTRQAFKGLLEGNNRSWIAGHYGSGRGKFEQIIGFDHPTFAEGPKENVLALLDRLPKGFRFQAPIDTITHSRGGLVAKYIALNIPQIPIGRGALVTCANGCGYYTAGWGVAKFLSVTKAILKGSGNPWLSFIAGIAQHSAEFFLNLPGSKAMTPGSDILKSIADVNPPGNIKYLPIIGDYDPNLIRKGFFKRLAVRGLDLIIKPFLGKHHDWVIGTKEQYIMPSDTYPTGYLPGRYRRHMQKAMHSDYFYLNRSTNTQEQLNQFLK